MTSRWRYDHFETSFLAFVENLDLASLVMSEQISSKRNEMARQLEAIGGKVKLLEQERERAYELIAQPNTSSEFIANKLRMRGEALRTASRSRHPSDPVGIDRSNIANITIAQIRCVN